jgi:hypothetical protein
MAIRISVPRCVFPVRLLLFWLILTVPAGAQTPSVFYSFASGADGDHPNALVQAPDGNFYGTTAYGGGKGTCVQPSGANTGCGTVFSIDSKGNEKVIYSFTGSDDGGVPAGLVLGPDGNLYGTTTFGGASVHDGAVCTNGNTNPSTGQPYNTPAYCCPSGDGSANLGCGTVFQMPLAGGAQSPVVEKSFHGALNGVQDDAYPGPLVPGIVGGTPALFGTAQPCSYCSSNGSLFSLVPSTQAFTSLPLNTTSSQFAYPNSVIQGLECPSGATSASQCTTNLYATAEVGPFAACCGGVLNYDLSHNTGIALCTFGQANNAGAGFSGNLRVAGTFTPDTIVQQAGTKFPSGEEWSMDLAPLLLTQAGDGSILGSSPWACFSTGSPNPSFQPTKYQIGSACGIAKENATLFQCQPPASGTVWNLNTIYSFTDASNPDANNKNVTGTTDGGGSLAGLTLAADGNYYGFSGYGMFQITPAEINYNATNLTGFIGSPNNGTYLPPQLSWLDAYTPLTILNDKNNETTDTPPWMIQGYDGSSWNFYGVSPGGGANQQGAIFKVAPAAAFAAPVQIAVSPSTIVLGSSSSSATLTWSVPNAFSTTARQCFASIQNGVTGGGSWSGAPNATFSASTYSGTATITPTAPGTYTYALTCGGLVTGFSNPLQVYAALSIGTTSLPSDTAGLSYSQQLQASGGIGPYTWTLASGSLPPNLTLDSSGLVHGTPSTPGVYSFTVRVADAESPAASKTATLTITIDGPSLAVFLSGTPLSGLTYGQTISLTATETPVEGLAQGYSWTVYDGTTPLVSNALSNGTGSYSFTTGALTAGVHTFTATYTSTSSYYPAGDSNVLTVNVSKGSPVISWTTPAGITYGTALNGSQLDATANVPGSFSYSPAAGAVLNAGTQTLAANFTPTDATDYAAASATVSLTVSKAATTTGLSASTGNANLNASVTFTATVNSGGGTPSGSVQFLSGTTVLNTATLSGHTATWTTTSLPAGTSTITAAYLGDNNFTGSNSSSVSVVVTSPAYSIAANPTSITMNAGDTKTATITLTAVGGYSGTVSFSCSGLPAYSTCGFNPASLTPSASNPTPATTFTFSTNVNTSSSLRPAAPSPFAKGTQIVAAGSLASLVLLLGLRRRVAASRALRNSVSTLALAFMAALLFGVLGCGGGGGSTSQPITQSHVTPSGSYTVVVSASASGSTAQTLNLSITVN